MLLAPSAARAIPAFARRYQVSCHTCHAMVFPELNPFGRRFKENGYQYPKGAEESYSANVADRPSPSERLDLLRLAPIALRGRVEGDVDADRAGSAITNATFYVPTKLQLLAGAPLYEDISFFAAIDFLPSPTVTALTIGFHNFFADPGLSFRIGRFTLADFMRPGERAYTLLTNPALQVHVGIDPFAVDVPDDGLEAWIRPLDGPIFVEAAAVQGNPSGLDLNLTPTLWGRVAGDLGPHRVSAFGVWGRTDLTPTNGTPKFTNEHSLVGVEGEGALPWGAVYGYGVRGHDTNAAGDPTQSVTYYAARAELDYTDYPWMDVVVRWDWVWSPDDATLFQNRLTVSLGILLATNVKIIGEVGYGMGKDSRVVGSVAFEAAF